MLVICFINPNAIFFSFFNFKTKSDICNQFFDFGPQIKNHQNEKKNSRNLLQIASDF